MLTNMVLGLTIAVSLILTSCGGGGGGGGGEEGAPEAAAPEATAPQNNIDGSKDTVATSTKPAETTQPTEAKKPEATAEPAAEQPSLTLMNVGKTRLTWNEVVKAGGATYQIYRREDKGSYGSDPIATVTDVVSYSLDELPGLYCYVIRAKPKQSEQTVESNEICVEGPTAVSFSALTAQNIVATEALSLLLQATGGAFASMTNTNRPITYACTKDCPAGFTVTSEGLVSWTPTLQQTGRFSVELTASAGPNNKSVQNLIIDVAAANLSLALSSSFDAESQNYTLQAQNTSNLGASARYSIAQTNGPNVTLSSAQPGVWTYRAPLLREATNASFEVTVERGALSRKESHTINMAANDRDPMFPALSARSLVATESLSLSLAASDPDGDAVQFSCVAECPRGLTVQSNGELSWTPDSSQGGSYQPLLQATAEGRSAQQRLSITVAPATQSLALNYVHNPEEARYTISAETSSNLSGSPTFIIDQITGPTLPLTSDGTGRWSFTAPMVREATQARFDVSVQQGALTRRETISIPLVVTDRAPLFAVIPSQSVIATELLNLNLSASDPDGDPIQFSCLSGCPSGLTLQAATGALTWRPDRDQAGSYVLLLQVESFGKTATQTLTIDVLAATQTLSLNHSHSQQQQSYSISAQSASNVTGTPSYTIIQTSGPAVSLTPVAPGQWTFSSPFVRQETLVSFDIRVQQGALVRTETLAFSLAVTDRAPEFAPLTSRTVVATEELSLTLSATDPDGDAVRYYCILDCPTGFQVDAVSGAVSWRPGLDQVGVFQPQLQAYGEGRATVQSLTVIVQAPQITIVSSPASGISGETVTLAIQTSSNLQPPLSYQISQSAGLTVSLGGDNGQWTFLAPEVDAPENLSFTIRISKGLYQVSHTLAARIDPRPIAPTVNAGPDRITRESLLLSGQVSPNGRTIAWTQISGPGTMTFTQAASAATSISADADGTYLLRLTATNSWGQSSSDDVQIVWDSTPPTISIGSDASTRDSLYREAQVSGASELYWSQVSGPGSVSFSAPNAAATTISADMDGTYRIELRAIDAAGNRASAQFSIIFDGQPPTVSAGPARAGSSASFNLAGEVSGDATSVSWSQVSGPGTVQFASAAAATQATVSTSGVYTLRLTAQDAQGNSASSETTLTYDGLAPIISDLQLANILADGYLNSAERNTTEPLLVSARVEDLSSYQLAYALISGSAPCAQGATFASTVPLANDALFTAPGNYRICIRATDTYGQASYGASAPFAFDNAGVTVSLSGLPAALSASTALAARVGGADVTHYRYKVGLASSTSCSVEAGYSSERLVSQLIDDSLQAYGDSSLRLCAIGRRASGNWQALNAAFQHNWTQDLTKPTAPSGLSLRGLSQRIKLSFTGSSDATSYLVVRLPQADSNWEPSTGIRYSGGQLLDGGSVKIVSANAQTLVFDDNLAPETTHYYAIYAADDAGNYSSAIRGSAQAQPVIAFNKAMGFDRLVRVLARDSLGRILVGGDFTIYQSTPALRLIRLNPDLSVDTSFTPPALNGSVYAITLDADGRIYIGGSFTAIGSRAANRIARLQADGTLDTTFAIGTGFNNTVFALAYDDVEDRLFVGGQFTTYAGATRNRLVALHDDGTVDTTFALGTGLNNLVYALALGPSSTVYVGGAFTSINGTVRNRLVRLAADGSIDTTFAVGTAFNSTVNAIKTDERGFVYVGGAFTSYNNSTSVQRFVRLSSAGAATGGFHATLRLNNQVRAIEIDPDADTVTLAGDFTAYGASVAWRIVRLLRSNWTLDTSFPVATASNNLILALQAGTGGSLFVGGTMTRWNTSDLPYFAKLGQNGQIQPETLLGTMANAGLYAVQKLDEFGSAVVGGNFTTYQGVTANRIVRINREGLPQANFAASINNGTVFALAYDRSNQKIYAGGTFTSVNTLNTPRRIIRFHENGSVDTNFNQGAGFDSDVYALGLDPRNGAIYVGGRFTTYKGVASARIARILPNGDLDPDFVVGTGFNNNVQALQVLGDGSVLVGGAFTTYNGQTANRIVKLLPNGTIDTSFAAGVGFNSTVMAIHQASIDGKIYIGGAFSTYQGRSFNRLVRVDATATIDPGFSISTGFNSTVNAIEFDADYGIVWVGGVFTTYRGAPYGRIAALNPDGSVLSSFRAPIGFNGEVRALSASPWGVLTGSLGSSYENRVFDYLGRLLYDGSLP